MIEAQKIDITTAPRHCGKPMLGAVPYSEVYLMDCVAGLRHYPDNYFDLAVVDPPYGIDVANDDRFGTQASKKAATITKKLYKERLGYWCANKGVLG